MRPAIDTDGRRVRIGKRRRHRHSHYDDPAPGVREFVTKYQQKHGARPDSLAALGYDSMRLLADAIRHAGPAMTGQGIRDAIAGTRGLPVVTGEITFDADRNPVGKRVVITEIRNGQLVLRKTIEPERKIAMRYSLKNA